MALVYTGSTSDTMRATDRRIQRSPLVESWEFERCLGLPEEPSL